MAIKRKSKAAPKQQQKKLPEKTQGEAGLPTEDQELALTAMAGMGDGFEDTDKDAFAVPFLRILQSNSPQVNEDEDAYTKGAKPGMFFNNVSNELFGKEIVVIPVHYLRSFIEWKPNRGGFVRDHGPDPRIKDKCVPREEGERHDYLENGNIIQDTRNHYLLVQREDGSLDPCILSLSSTGIKHSRKWMSMMRSLLIPTGAAAPMFSSKYRIKTVLNKNDDGSWYQIGEKQTAVERIGWISQEELEEVKSFRNLITSGAVTADYSSLDEEVYSEEEHDETGEEQF